MNTDNKDPDKAAPSVQATQKRRRRIWPLIALLVVVIGIGVAYWKLRDPKQAAVKPRHSVSQPTSVDTGLSRLRSVATSERRNFVKVEEFINDVDPSKAGWQTEVVNDLAADQLKLLGKLLSHPQEIDSEHLESFTTDEFRCQPLRPLELKEVFSDACLTVRRELESGDGVSEPPSLTLDAALKGLIAPFDGADDDFFETVSMS